MGIFSRLTGGGDPAPSSPASNPEPAPAPAPSRAAAAPARAAAPAPASTSGRDRTTIANGSKVVGDVIGNTELYVEGRVEGQIRVDHRVEIGPNGEVRGTISAQSLRIAGKVTGNVTGKEKVEVLATGTLQGDVHSPKLSIGEGGFFKGSVDMSEVVDKSKPKPAEPRAEERLAGKAPEKPAADARPPAEAKDDVKDGVAQPAAIAAGLKTSPPAGGDANANKGRNGK